MVYNPMVIFYLTQNQFVKLKIIYYVTFVWLTTCETRANVPIVGFPVQSMSRGALRLDAGFEIALGFHNLTTGIPNFK